MISKLINEGSYHAAGKLLLYILFPEILKDVIKALGNLTGVTLLLSL